MFWADVPGGLSVHTFHAELREGNYRLEVRVLAWAEPTQMSSLLSHPGPGLFFPLSS